MTKEQIRHQMYLNIQGYNIFLTKEHLDTLDWHMLLANTHPIDRPDFRRQLESLKLI
ncbi:MAG TPA: hypothetical protein VMW53_07095 [archaeon]|nr:hypothetical protein [archaeon]